MNTPQNHTETPPETAPRATSTALKPAKPRAGLAGAATKERILQAALVVFNQKGTQSATIRDVAQVAGLSAGNLCYHFPTLQDIIRALYLRLCERFDAIIAESMQQPALSISALTKLFTLVYEGLYAHRFLMLDFVPVMRALPDVQAHYRRLTQMRRDQAAAMTQGMVALGILQPEPLAGLYVQLATPITMIGDFWISHSMIHGEESHDPSMPPPIRRYVYLTLLCLRPYLTGLGLQQWQAEWADIEGIGNRE